MSNLNFWNSLRLTSNILYLCIPLTWTSCLQCQNHDDPAGLQEKTEYLLKEWKNVLLSPMTEIELSRNFNLFVHRMNMNGILKSDDMITRFDSKFV